MVESRTDPAAHIVVHPLRAYPALCRIAWRRLRKKPFQYVLLVLGIALGVAMIVAVDLANRSAMRAFDLSAEAVTGKATHRLLSGNARGFDQQIYIDLRKAGYDLTAPVVEGYLRAGKMGNHPMRLMGVDPFAEPVFRPYLWAQQDFVTASKFLTRPDGVVLSQDVAAKYNLALGDNFAVQVEGNPATVTLVGLIAPADDIGRQRLQDVIIADVATAQEMLRMHGRLSHIDLILNDDATAAQIERRLPAGVRLEAVNTRNNAIKQMSAAFTINLTALSLVALLVGIFLIYNTITFSIVQRRPIFGIMRCLGVSRGQLFGIIMLESLTAALIGAAIGLFLGVWLGEGLVGLVSKSINDYYFVADVRSVDVAVPGLVKGLVVGIAAALFATVPPAYEAMRTTPATVLRRSSLERKVGSFMPWLWVAWLLLGGFGVLMLRWPGNNLIVAFVGLYAVLISFALITPPVAQFVMCRLAACGGLLFGPIGRMAPRNIVRSLSRTSIAVAALMTAISVIVGVSMMVGSFRQTFASWLELSWPTDIYVSPPTLTSGRPRGSLPADAVSSLGNWPGVRKAVTTRYASVFDPDWGRDVQVMAVSGDISEGKQRLTWTGDNQAEVWPRVMSGEGVMVSEPLVSRQNLKTPPGSLTLMTDSGPKVFPILAVFSDYTSDQGVVLISQASYQRNWADADVTTMSLQLESGANPARVLDLMRAKFEGRDDIVIQSGRSIREAAMATFDRSFAVTRAVQLVATVVAFVGVLSALMSLQLVRAREYGTFRAVGMSTRQLWGLTFAETLLMGGMASAMALPSGFALAWILIHIINVRSFGWTLEMQWELGHFGQAVMVALVAALAAGVYPAWRSGRISIATAIREE